MTANPSENLKIRLTEEVPGVPDNERWFVCGGPFKYDPERAAKEGHGYPHFSTLAEGKAFLANEGITNYVVEHFEP